jgi:hypothetical protein
MISQVRLKEIFTYKDGNFIWNIRKTGIKYQTIAGNLNCQKGHIYICIDKKRYLAHRLVWLWHHGFIPQDQIDHIDGNRANNKIENLRLATVTQNNQNSKLRITSKTGFKGVSYISSRKKYWARVFAFKRQYSLGYFDTAEEAHEAYKIGATKHHKEFARFK